MIKGLFAFWSSNAPKQTPWEKARGTKGAREEAQDALLPETTDEKELEELATKGEMKRLRVEATKRWKEYGLKGDKAKYLALTTKEAEIRSICIDLLGEGKTTHPANLANLALNLKGDDALRAITLLIAMVTKDMAEMKPEDKKRAEQHKDSALIHLESLTLLLPEEKLAKPCFDALFRAKKIKAKTADNFAKNAKCKVVKRAAEELLFQKRL